MVAAGGQVNGEGVIVGGGGPVVGVGQERGDDDVAEHVGGGGGGALPRRTHPHREQTEHTCTVRPRKSESLCFLVLAVTRDPMIGASYFFTKGTRTVAHRKVYLAVGRTHTRLYRFDPIDGDVRVIDNVAAYEAGYAAMGARYRGDDKEPLLLAVSGNKLITIDPTTGTLSEDIVEGLPDDQTWFDGDTDADGKTLLIMGGPDKPSYTIDTVTKKATPGHRPGGGRWDDFSSHPRSGWLLSVEGDNGDLLHVDTDKDPMKTVLKEQVFPPAEASPSEHSRKSYAATFFDNEGHFYTIDSAGNVNTLDLTDVTVPDRAQRIGDGKIRVGDLEIVNGAGRITPLPIQASYDEILVTKRALTSWETSSPAGKVYSVELTLATTPKDGGTPRDVRQFRISFDLPTVTGAKVEASGVVVLCQDGKAYVDSDTDQLLPAGSSRPVSVQITVPGDPQRLPAEFPLAGLKATRLA